MLCSLLRPDRRIFPCQRVPKSNASSNTSSYCQVIVETRGVQFPCLANFFYNFIFVRRASSPKMWLLSDDGLLDAIRKINSAIRAGGKLPLL